MLAMVLLIGWQVLCRYVLYISAGYAEELARLSIVWCIFIGAGVAVRLNDHMNVDVLLKRFPKYVQLLITVLIFSMIAVYSYVLLVYGIRHVRQTWGDTATSLGFSRGLFHLPASLIGGIMLVYSVVNCIIYVHNFFRPGAKIKREGL
jgi:TRAP-type C4-dicarboxylate transport system permease small subunit